MALEKSKKPLPSQELLLTEKSGFTENNPPCRHMCGIGCHLQQDLNFDFWTSHVSSSFLLPAPSKQMVEVVSGVFSELHRGGNRT